MKLKNLFYDYNMSPNPKCGLENAYFEFMDEKGAHYICPDCEYEWCDNSVKIDEDYSDDEE